MQMKPPTATTSALLSLAKAFRLIPVLLAICCGNSGGTRSSPSTEAQFCQQLADCDLLGSASAQERRVSKELSEKSSWHRRRDWGYMHLVLDRV
jgi:hypothetical protein